MAAAVALAAAAVPSSIRAQSAASPVPLLDVPYLPQSEALCGGAAIAMVMRYWGHTGVYAETFAGLVDVEAGGIRGRELIRALEHRGFDARSFAGDATQVRAALKEGRPPVALVEDRPGRFHYVVIVGWRQDGVIVHDPARAPFRVIDGDAFLRAWSASGFWTLLAQPRAARKATAGEGDAANVTPQPSNSVCNGMVEEGIRLAGAGDLTGAQRVLDVAAADCDGDAAPWRELAGVHALRGDWAHAARDAGRALVRNPHDEHAARTLATSLFLQGQDEAALDAWNRIDAPLVDIADIRGLERTRFAVAAEALDLKLQTLLTRRRLARARKRLSALPSLLGSRVVYEPGEGERAKVMAAVVERPLVPVGVIPIAAIGLRAATDRELTVGVASPAGGGELWRGAWRWWERRPRLAIALAAPSPIGGVWSVEAFVERQSYGMPRAEFSERRRGVLLTASDWITGTTRVEAGGSFDRWANGSTGSIHGGITKVFDSGRGTASVDAALMAGAHRAGLMNATVEWQSALERAGPTWHFRGGSSAVASGAPLALWPGAGTGQGRETLLRAHSLLNDGVIRGVFGRRLAHGGAEWRYWRRRVWRTLHAAPAVFVDAARAFDVPSFGDARSHIDAGAGIRVAVPGAGILRVDLARGLRDGETTLSFGWIR